ncbi:LPS-assembly protein LptD [Geobacter sp. SVR]|uniref:LPS-assembly protein LptD n=1 Tax=Geobacter sp. SVR TaxID=2495594 RepID=UPI00143EFC64|nr:LPS assembly protein LptD [Geobacter sp. SVR]BCS52982.1 LPS-assembly protein LptD [Geobacter sp. SVR]GCF84366.1 LPS-assembly protein LptD [Geobacter sp. SVR]
MQLKRLIPLVCLALLLCAVPALGADDIVIKADSISQEQSTDTVIASGNVVLVWEGMNLTADRATYDRTTRILTATGNIVATKGDDVLRGESISLDVASGRGELELATVNVKQVNATFTGKKIVRLDETTLVATDSELTTCEMPHPSWKFGAGELKVNLLGYAIGKNVVFYVKDIPVLYLPWVAFPVVRERTSGLLFPRFGYSKSRGAQLDIPLYWVISPSQDAVFDLDIQTKRGIGTGVDYRYLRKQGSEGNFAGYLIYDMLDEHWRGQVIQNHREIFSPDLNLRMNVNQTSDRNFLHDFGEKSGDYNRQSSDTVVNALKTWQHYALTAHLRYTEDYYAPDNSNTLQTLPAIGLAAVRQRLFDLPLYFDLDASAENLYRETDTTGQRLHAFPRLTLLGGIPGYLNASLFFGAHLRAYSTDNIPSGSTIHRTDGSLLPDLGLSLSTSVSRVYDLDWDHLKKVRHELTPEISYRYVTDQDQSRLPFYDYGDRLVPQNILYYGLTSQLGGKFQRGDINDYREISRIRLMQGYSIDGSRRDLLTLVDAGRPWTDVILETDTWLHPQARLTFDSRFNVYDKQISYAAPGLEFDDRQGTTVGAGYRMSRNVVEYLEGHVATKLFKPWTLGYTARYSFDRSQFLEAVYSVEYRHQCWTVSLAYHDRPGNQSVTFNFNLAGLTNSFR